MSSALKLQIKWKSIQPQLCPDNNGKIKYVEFLDSYSMQKLGAHQVPSDVRPALAALYDHFPLLKAAFTKWDENHDGKVRARLHNSNQVIDLTLFSLSQIDRWTKVSF